MTGVRSLTAPSPILESWFPLFLESAGTFLGILGHEGLDADGRLDLEHVGFGDALRLTEGPQHVAYRYRAVFGNQLRELKRLFEGVTIRHDVSDESIFLGLAGADVPACEENVSGDGVRDLAP